MAPNASYPDNLPPQGPKVFIVGGGPTGLAMALLLDRFGIDFLLVERNPSITDHPRARGTWIRTMELFRQWGIEDKVRRRGLPDNASGFAFVESMSGREYGRTPREIDYGQTPAWKCTVSQDVVEEELLDVVKRSRHGRVLYSTEFVSFEQSESGVDILTRDVETGVEKRYTSSYLIAADGAGSGIRHLCDIAMVGPSSLALMNNDYWMADLRRIPSVREIGIFRVSPKNQAITPASILNTNGHDRWLTLTKVGDGNEKSVPQRSEDEVKNLARAHTGIPDLEVKILNRSVWRVTKQVAQTYARGRVFLVGDSAHRFPPTGGYGMNTGIQDAHNLAWKIALVVRGLAGAALLDSYDVERRPVGQANADFSFGNSVRFVKMDEAFRADNQQAINFWIRDAVHHIHSTGLGLGFSYEEGAVVGDGTAKKALLASQYFPSDRPGGRFPHLWLDLSRKRSTLDLFDRNFVLVHGPQSADWVRAAADVSRTLGLSIDTLRLESVDARDGLEMSPYGAVLVRPDGHVAWRMPWVPNDPAAELGKVLTRILCRSELGVQ